MHHSIFVESFFKPEIIERYAPDILRAMLVTIEVAVLVVVSHEMRFAREAADRVVFLEEGAIVEQGAPALIFGPDAGARTRAFVSEIGH